VKVAIVRHPAMLCQNQTDRCLHCQTGSAKHPDTCCRRTGQGAPPPNRRSQQTPQPTPQPTPSLPGTPPAPHCNNAGAQHSYIVNVAPRYSYLPTAHHCPESFTLDASAQESQNDIDFDTDMLTDTGTATG